MAQKFIARLSLIIALIFLLTSCATIPEEHKGAATGAGIGAATGAIAGAIIGKDTKSAVLGGLAGALIGGAIGHYAYDQKRSREQTAQTYNYKPSYGTVLTVEEVAAEPQSIKPGETVELRMTYAILNPTVGAETSLVETRTITHNGTLVGKPEVQVKRADGTYTSTIPLRLPQDAAPGTYSVSSTVQTETTKDTKEMTFTVI